MSFSSFPTHYATNITTNPVGQFATSKFTPNIPQFISAPDGSLHYVRNESNSFVTPNIPQQGTSNEQIQPLLTIPITVPGAKPGDAQQIVHIQVLNPNINITPVHQVPSKYQMGPMQLPVQNQQPAGTTVLTVAYSPQDNKFLTNHAFPENMTVVAAVQPQDLHLLAQAQIAQTPTNKPMDQPALHSNEQYSESITIKQEPSNEWENVTVAPTNQPNNNGNFQQQQNNNCATQFSSVPLNLQPYLKFNSTPVKFEAVEQAPAEEPVKPKRKRKTKKKPPKEKTPKPGQVLIAKASDGTTIFCCPECQMAYSEKENLEQHLTEHKIERRYICDICGAGLKRKEHLERHKSGHNPDRPYICSICLKGFKRKEHLNLHFVIHSGEKNEICGECGKGFYRKDHLRKHANSHAAKRIKEELNAKSLSSLSDIELTIQNQINSTPEIVNDNNNCSISISLNVDMSDKQTDTQTISLPH